MSVAKIIELVGSSEKSWEDATNQALITAHKTLRGIRGVQVISQTAIVNQGKISEYRTTVKISFGVETVSK